MIARCVVSVGKALDVIYPQMAGSNLASGTFKIKIYLYFFRFASWLPKKP